MRSFLKWFGIVVLVLLVLVVIMAGIAGGDDDSPATASSKAAPVTAAATAAPTVAATAKPAAPTAAPAPTATPVAKVGTRQSPVPLGQPYSFSKDNRQYSVQVVSVVLNAWPQIEKANSFNEKPPEGNDYILVEMKLDYSKGAEDKPYRTTDGGHKFYASNRFWGAPSLLGVPPEPRFSGQDIFPGAGVQGWLGGRYLPVELIGEAVLVYDDVYFALK